MNIRGCFIALLGKTPSLCIIILCPHGNTYLRQHWFMLWCFLASPSYYLQWHSPSSNFSGNILDAEVCNEGLKITFLAATKQLYEWYFLSVCPSVRPSVCPSVRLSHLFDYVPIIVSSWNFQELSLGTRVRSMQKVKVGGQRSRSQRSTKKNRQIWPRLGVSGL